MQAPTQIKNNWDLMSLHNNTLPLWRICYNKPILVWFIWWILISLGIRLMFDLTLNDIDISIKCVHWTQAKRYRIKINKTLIILSSDKKIRLYLSSKETQINVPRWKTMHLLSWFILTSQTNKIVLDKKYVMAENAFTFLGMKPI